MTQTQQRPRLPDVNFSKEFSNHTHIVTWRMDDEGNPDQPTTYKQDKNGKLFARYRVNVGNDGYALVCGNDDGTDFFRPPNKTVWDLVALQGAQHVAITRLLDEEGNFQWAVEEATDGAQTSPAAAPAADTSEPMPVQGRPSAAPAPSRGPAPTAGGLKTGNMPLQLADDIFAKCWEMAGSYEVSEDSSAGDVSEETQYKIAFTLFSATTKEGYESRLPPDWTAAAPMTTQPVASEPPMPEPPPESDDDLPF
jgi:hypothetical protein